MFPMLPTVLMVVDSCVAAMLVNMGVLVFMFMRMGLS
jgi:hypothetical protein